MPTVDKLLHRPVHRYKRHKQHQPWLFTLRHWKIFHLRKCILLHCVVQLCSGTKDSGQRHRNHRPYLRSMFDWEILYRNQPEHLHKLDHLQRYHRSGKQCGFCHRG